MDRITADRTQLFTQGELHRSLWYFDPKIEDQLQTALIAEHNCVRDLCRTDDSLEAVSEYFHAHPYYMLPAFSSRLDWSFINNKAATVIRLLDKSHTTQDNIATAHLRLHHVQQLLGQHWANSLALSPRAMINSQLVQAAYSPAAALRLEQWLVKLQSDLNGPALKAHLDDFKTYSNRAHRLAGLIALDHEGATLRVASAQDVQNFSIRIANLNTLLKNADTYKYNRDGSLKESKRASLGESGRHTAKENYYHYNRLLIEAHQKRAALVKQIQSSLTITSDQSAGFIGLKLSLNPQQQAYLNDEINRLRSGVKGGYGEGRAGLTAFKSGWLPLGLMLWQAQTLGEAWREWKKLEGLRGIKELLVFGGAISGTAASALAVYQSVHIGLIDKSFRAVQLSSSGESGMLLAVKIGKLGLNVSSVITPLAFFAALGVSLSNFNRWVDAIRTGSGGEKVGAFVALTSDTTSVVLSGFVARKVYKERKYLKNLAKTATVKDLGREWEALRAYMEEGPEAVPVPLLMDEEFQEGTVAYFQMCRGVYREMHSWPVYAFGFLTIQFCSGWTLPCHFAQWVNRRPKAAFPESIREWSKSLPAEQHAKPGAELLQQSAELRYALSQGQNLLDYYQVKFSDSPPA